MSYIHRELSSSKNFKEIGERRKVSIMYAHHMGVVTTSSNRPILMEFFVDSVVVLNKKCADINHNLSLSFKVFADDILFCHIAYIILKLPRSFVETFFYIFTAFIICITCVRFRVFKGL